MATLERWGAPGVLASVPDGPPLRPTAILWARAEVRDPGTWGTPFSYGLPTSRATAAATARSHSSPVSTPPWSVAAAVGAPGDAIDASTRPAQGALAAASEAATAHCAPQADAIAPATGVPRRLQCSEEMEVSGASGGAGGAETAAGGEGGRRRSSSAPVVPAESVGAGVAAGWSERDAEDYRLSRRQRAMELLLAQYRCEKPECSLAAWQLQPPPLERQQAMSFKETIDATCPACGDTAKVHIWY